MTYKELYNFIDTNTDFKLTHSQIENLANALLNKYYLKKRPETFDE